MNYPFPISFALLIAIGCASGDGGDNMRQEGSCVGSIDEVNSIWLRCPTTRPTAPFMVCDDPSVPALVYTGICESVSVVIYSWGTHAKECFYSKDGALQGVRAIDDVPTFCNRKSSSIKSSGVVTCMDERDKLVQTCKSSLGGTALDARPS